MQLDERQRNTGKAPKAFAGTGGGERPSESEQNIDVESLQFKGELKGRARRGNGEVAAISRCVSCALCSPAGVQLQLHAHSGAGAHGHKNANTHCYQGATSHRCARAHAHAGGGSLARGLGAVGILEMVKDELTALGEESGEPFVGVFGGGTYDNVVNYILLFGCDNDGTNIGPTVAIREDWLPSFMNENRETEEAMYFEIDGEPGRERDWTMTMNASESSVYYRPPPTVGVQITKAFLTEGMRELFVWLNPDDERVVQMIFSTEGLRSVAAPALEYYGTEEQLALFEGDNARQ